METRFAQRRDKLRKLVRKAGADALLVTDFTNVTYLTGFTGDDSFLLVAAVGEVLISDARYTQQLEEECPGLELEIRSSGVRMSDALARVVTQVGAKKLGVESATLSMAQYEIFREALAGIELVATKDLVEELRIVKDAEEIAAIRRAAVLARRGFDVLRASLTPNKSEKQVATELEYQLRLFGARGCSFPPIIAAGPRAALPHATPTDARISDSDFLLVDWGANEGLYVSDLTRILVNGKISPKLERIYGVVLNAQLAAIEAIRPGVTCHEVDQAARAIIAKAGHAKHFGHGLGHGIGLQVHEAPRLGPNQQRMLKSGMVVTVEPGIYLPGWGGVRIEDDVLVTRDGHEVLSNVPKQLEQCVLS